MISTDIHVQSSMKDFENLNFKKINFYQSYKMRSYMVLKWEGKRRGFIYMRKTKILYIKFLLLIAGLSFIWGGGA